MDWKTSVVNKKNITVLVYYHTIIPLLFLKRIWKVRITGIGVSVNYSGLILDW